MKQKDLIKVFKFKVKDGPYSTYVVRNKALQKTSNV